MITLQNEGLLQIEFLTTMGVNVKESDNAIGYFGTGLKYAIAVMLRETVDFKLYIGTNEYTFYTQEKTLRDKTFHYCYMKGPHDSINLQFTTEFGKNWDLWQAYRELHSNTLDENGMIYIDETIRPTETSTTFIINNENLFEVKDVFLNYNNPKLCFANDEIEIYEGSSNHIYYKGIRAKDLNSQSKYTYNILRNSTLTEDRLLCYDFSIKECINNALIEMASTEIDNNSKNIIKDIVTSDNSSFEGDLNMLYNKNKTVTEDFINVIDEIAKENENSVHYSVMQSVNNARPSKPLTDAERKENFLTELEYLCEEYDVEIGKTQDCKLIELVGGILESDNEDDIEDN